MTPSRVEFTLRLVVGFPEVHHLVIYQDGEFVSSAYRRWDHPYPVSAIVDQYRQAYPEDEIVFRDLTIQ